MILNLFSRSDLIDSCGRRGATYPSHNPIPDQLAVHLYTITTCGCLEVMMAGKSQEPTESSKKPIRTSYLGQVTVYQPIRDQYFMIRSGHGSSGDDKAKGSGGDKAKKLNRSCLLIVPTKVI